MDASVQTGVIPMTKVYNGERGFSLIELALALMLVGIFAGTLMQKYHQYEVTLATSITQAKGGQNGPIAVALQKYYLKNGHLPCPADPARNIDSDPMAGVGQGDSSGNCTVSGGMLSVTGDGTTVYEGSIPYTDLNTSNTGGLQAPDTIDGWGHKLAYWVSAPLTSGSIAEPNLTDLSHTGIDIWAPVPDTTTSPYSPTHPGPQLAGSAGWAPYFGSSQPKFELVVFSYGSSGRGGYTRSGYEVPCSGTGLDVPNCPGGSGAASAAYYVDSPYGSSNFSIRGFNTGSGLFYDDYLLAFQISTAIDFWNTQDRANTTYNPPTGFVGINNQTPQEPVDVKGSVLVQNTVAATSFCNPAIIPPNPLNPSDHGTVNVNCFTPNVIAGTTGINGTGGMDLGGATFTGFALNAPLSGTSTTSVPNLGFAYAKPLDCSTQPAAPSGKNYITGIDSAGNITCGNFAN
jgi:prepilin-type N-terminal cleavage/methylation domain-containing protein